MKHTVSWNKQGYKDKESKLKASIIANRQTLGKDK